MEAKEIKAKNEAPKPNIKTQREKDQEKVKGVFIFFDVKGGQLDFVYKKYKGDEVEKFSLIDGHQYELPYGVARHLNRSGWMPVHKYALDENGKPLQRVTSKERRYMFQSLEFADLEDMSTSVNQIVTVENV